MEGLLRWCRKKLKRGWRSATGERRDEVRPGEPNNRPAPKTGWDLGKRAEAKPPRRKDSDYIADIKASIDQKRWSELRDHWFNNDSHGFNHPYIKYFDVDRWLPQAVSIARRVGLMEGGRKRVFDIGCGSGLFGYTCKYLGHDITGLDIGNPMFMAMCEALGVPVVVDLVIRHKPLPAQLTGFDVVTSISAKFHVGEIIDGKAQQYVWNDDDWDYFLADVKSRLNPGGLYLFRFKRMFMLPPGLLERMARARELSPGTYLFTRDELPG